MYAYEDTNKELVKNIGNIESRGDKSKMVHLEYDGGQSLTGSNNGVAQNNGFQYNVLQKDGVLDKYVGTDSQIPL